MAPEIVAAVIVTVGGLVVALINAYHDDLVNLLRLRGNYAQYKGRWKCKWIVLSPSDAHPGVVDDQVEITRVRGALLRGEGSAPGFGKYRLDGKASEFAFTLEYSGEGSRKDLVGVVILKKLTPSKLEGVWCQYSVDGSLKSGTTIWEKIV